MNGRYRWPPAVASWLLRVTARIVPHRQREEWLETWEGEVRTRWRELGEHRRRSPLFQVDVVARVLGAASHALFLRLREWTPEILLQDLRFALRALVRRPTFTLVAIATLTIGIGATTTVFSVVHSILLRPLPYHEPDRLVMVWQTLPQPGGERANVSLPNLLDWRARSTTLEAITATTTGGGFVTITGGEEPRRVPAASVADDFFDVLGVGPILGRGFLPGENDPAAPPVAVLSHRMWVRDFGAREDVLGSTLEISGDEHTIVGVAPPSLALPDPGVEVWRPLRPENGLVVSGPVGRDGYVVRAIGRLAPGATVARVQAEMDAISGALEREYPTTNEGVGAWVRPLHEEVVRDARPILLILLGAVAILLLIACANVANLQLFRSVERRREMDIRTALGAGRLRLSRQLLTEGVVLGLAGGAGGLLLAAIGVHTLVRFLPADLPRVGSVAIDPTVLWFTGGISLLATVLFGLGPAIRCTRVEPVAAIRRGGRLGLGGPVVVAQLSLALILGTGAGLLVKSLWKLNAVDPGLDSHGVVTMRVRTTSSGLSGPARSARFADVVRRVRALPETEAAGLIQHAPFGGGNWRSETALEGDDETETRPQVDVRVTSRGYFESVGIPLLEGREFDERDGPSDTPIALVSRSLVDAFWPDRSPLGERIHIGMIGEWATVVGIVGDVHHAGLGEPVRPTLYRPYSQWSLSYATLVVRVTGDAERALPRIRGVVRAMDPTLAISREETLDAMIQASTLAPRSRTLLIGTLAVVTAVLSLVGVYGVLTYSVRARRRELGIRLAIGAGAAAIRRLVVGRAAVFCAIATVIGLAGAVALGRWLDSMLFEVDPLDPLVLGASVALLILTGLASASVPAIRAGRVDPARTLKHE